MHFPRRLALALAALLVGLAAAADPDALEHNRRLLERWRSDPDHYRRLQRDLRAFHALPRARQEQLRRLDELFPPGAVAGERYAESGMASVER